jgi:cytochrome b
MRSDSSIAARTVRVWDPLVRVGHWLLALSVLFAWLTRHRPGPWHEWLGYVALVIVAVRLVWGWRGSHHARFAQFVRGPRTTLAYTLALLGGHEPRTLGHNPLGAWMILALLVTVTLVGTSGWLYTTDRFWGVEWVEQLHRWLTNALWALVGLHVAGVLYTSLRHRENLVGAMLHGRKPAPGSPSDTPSFPPSVKRRGSAP